MTTLLLSELPLSNTEATTISTCMLLWYALKFAPLPLPTGEDFADGKVRVGNGVTHCVAAVLDPLEHIPERQPSCILPLQPCVYQRVSKGGCHVCIRTFLVALPMCSWWSHPHSSWFRCAVMGLLWRGVKGWFCICNWTLLFYVDSNHADSGPRWCRLALVTLNPRPQILTLTQTPTTKGRSPVTRTAAWWSAR